MTDRICRPLDIFVILLSRRYVTIGDLVLELGADRKDIRKVLKRLAQRFELTVEPNALDSRGCGQTAYYFKAAYKKQLISEVEPDDTFALTGERGWFGATAGEWRHRESAEERSEYGTGTVVMQLEQGRTR